jgi:hypothetical protein
MKINRLPGTRGTYKAKTEKKTQMYSYQVNGTEQERQDYMAAKEAEGYPAVIDQDYGLLFFSPRNVGIEGDLDVYVDQDGTQRIIAYNQGVRKAEELRGVVSDSKVDDLIIEALTKGQYAKKIAVSINTEEDSNLGKL